MLAALAVTAGDYRAAFFWLGVQILIDATDGLLARALRVKEQLPHFDGARLDDIVDYLCYVFVPMFLLLHAGNLEGRVGVAVAAFVLIASGYGFSQADAKVMTTDYFFTGFPSYWNLVALYLFVWRLPPAVNAAILLGLGVLVFVPLRYVYPSRTRTLQGPTNLLGAVWGVLLIWIVWRLPEPNGMLVSASLIFPAYYMLLSAWLNWRPRRTA